MNASAAFRESLQNEREVELAAGPAGGGLEAMLESGRPAKTGSRVVVETTYEEAHAIYSLLVCLPLYFATEETFHSRVGAFTENLIDMAHGFLMAVRELGG
ncbi:hypothetical protein [Actinomadura madurae]|uniref:hypothetical protein n=1 Tax=Actinomadura madurae TaxID=1993 RepID=UPI0011607E88|nr:hypothetical protein [Actinomadura madurae]